MPLINLYPRLTSFASLHAAARRAQLGKRYLPAVLAFNANLEAELLRLQEELRSFTYRPGPYRQFRIRDPKPRVISAAPYRDRVVHHALCAAIVPSLQRQFHPGSHANRVGFGSHRALRRFTAAAARHRWVLQADIRLYFPSIDLTILRAQLAAVIACPGTLWLLDQILANGATIGPALDAFPGDTLLTPLERPQGLPIGNLTSQFLANLHLNAIDHTLSALPGVRAYLRYVDDLALFADHPEPLHRARQLRGLCGAAGQAAGAQSQLAQGAPAVASAAPGGGRRSSTPGGGPFQPAELECSPGPWPHLAAAAASVCRPCLWI